MVRRGFPTRQPPPAKESFLEEQLRRYGVTALSLSKSLILNVSL